MGQGGGPRHRVDRRDRDEASAVHRGMEVASAMRAPQGSHVIFTSCLMYFREGQLLSEVLNITGVQDMWRSLSGCSDLGVVRHRLHSVLSPSLCYSICSAALGSVVWSCFFDFSLKLQEAGPAMPPDSVSMVCCRNQTNTNPNIPPAHADNSKPQTGFRRAP